MPLQINQNRIPLMRSGVALDPITFKIDVVGATGDYDFNNPTGDFLPPGVTFDAETGVFGGTPAVGPADIFSSFAAYKVTDTVTETGFSQIHLKAVESDDPSKILICLLGDSISNSFGSTAPHIDGIKPKLRRLLGDEKFQIYAFGFDGAPVVSYGTYFNEYADLVYNAARPRNYFVVQGGANDIQAHELGVSVLPGANNVERGRSLASRFQTILNTAKAKGYRTVVQTILAGTYGGGNENLRLEANQVLRGTNPLTLPSTYINADVKADVGGRTEFNSLAATSNVNIYPDGIHLKGEGNRLWAETLVTALGLDSGNPLIAVFDIKTLYVSGEDIVPFSVIPFGGNLADAKSYRWLVDGVQKSTIQNPSAAAFAGITPGLHTMRLEVTTTTDGMVYAEKQFVVTLNGNIGGGSITPETANFPINSFVDLVANNITSPIWRKRQGPGSLSNPDSNPLHRRYTDSGDHSIAFIEAAETMYPTVPLGVVTANQEWDLSGGGGTPNITYKPKLTQIGDKVKYYLPQSFFDTYFSAGNSIAIYVPLAGYYWSLNGKTKRFTSFIGSGANLDGPTLVPTLGINTITFELATGNTVKVYHNNAYLFTFIDHIPSMSLGILFNLYDDLSFSVYPRPDVFGSGITEWRAGMAALTPQALAVAGFSIPETLLAGQNLVITDDSENCTSFEYRITNAKYTNALIYSGASPTPNLTRFVRMGANEITQKGLNSAGNNSASHTVTVNERLIDVGNVTHYDFAAPIGQTLVGSVEGFDENGNRSGYSNEDEITVS